MAKGERFPAEWSTFADAQTGAIVKQLTNYKGHSHHLYFTNSGWYSDAEGRKLLFGSDRCNLTNLFSLNLDSGEIRQLTERNVTNSQLLFTSINPRRAEAYFWHARTLIALDLDTLKERPLYRVPDGYDLNITSVTADGNFVCTGIYEDLSSRFKIDLLHGYVGFAEYWEAKPHSQILLISTETGQAQVVFEERYWIGHANASPTQPDIATYCHEGPWEKVDQRIWGLNLRTGESWKLRPTEVGEQVGHEYWLADGEHIGYHGRSADGQSFYGSVRYDNTERIEATFPGESMHFQSNDLRLIVGDGTRNDPKLMVWRMGDGAFGEPRVVLTHHGTFQIQQLHVHPRFSPDGSQILFTSDMSGYGNLYLVDVPAWER
ncbi:MAG: PD40 domain-containing protein [Anaerolineae bacterium]|nr:PD40 domain-containing protein [Anaerolineae bacterium]